MPRRRERHSMNYRLLDSAKWHYLEQGIDQFLFAETHLRHEHKHKHKASFDDEISFAPQTSAKQKRERENVPRICLKMLTLNQLCVSKLPISLFSAKRKQPNLQIHFCLENAKCKLAFSPLPTHTLITITQSKGEIVIKAKNAMQYQLQMGVEGSKPKWIAKSAIDNARIIASYHNKRYNEDALDVFFRSNSTRFQIVDPRPKPSCVQLQTQLETKDQKIETPPCQEMDMMQRIINGNGIDWHVQRMLATIKTNKPISIPLPLQPPQTLEKVEKPVESVPQQCKSQNDCETGEQPHQQANYRYQQEFASPTFKKLTAEQLQQSLSSRQSIIDLQAKEKQSILFDILKIKKFRKSDYSIKDKELPCPIYTCNTIFPDQRQLRAHLLTTHKQLGKCGLRVGSDGRLHYSQKTMDFVLQLAWLYPSEIKKIIKKMK